MCVCEREREREMPVLSMVAMIRSPRNSIVKIKEGLSLEQYDLAMAQNTYVDKKEIETKLERMFCKLCSKFCFLASLL